MDPNEDLGFFSSRHLLQAGRLQATGDLPLDPSDALTRRVATWLNASVAGFTPIFAIAVIFGWISLKASLEIAVGAGLCVLVCAILLGAVKVRRAFGRTKNPRPEMDG
jgi:hypothetical protein